MLGSINARYEHQHFSSLTRIHASLYGNTIVFFFNQKFNPRYWLGLSVALAGLIFLAIEDLSLTSGKLQGDTLALISAGTFAVYFLVIEELRTKKSTLSILQSCCWLTALITFVSILVKSVSLLEISHRGLMLMTVFAFVTVLGWILITYSLRYVNSSIATLVWLADPVLVAIESAILLQERLRLFDWISFCLILLGVGVAIIASEKETSIETSADT